MTSLQAAVDQVMEAGQRRGWSYAAEMALRSAVIDAMAAAVKEASKCRQDCRSTVGQKRVVVLSRDPAKRENRLSDERDFCASCSTLAALDALRAK